MQREELDAWNRSQAATDAALYGNGYLVTGADGRVRRVDPTRVKVEPEEVEDDPLLKIAAEPILTCFCGLDWVPTDGWSIDVEIEMIDITSDGTITNHRDDSVQKMPGIQKWTILHEATGRRHDCTGPGSRRVGTVGEVVAIVRDQARR
jgi:hypothetical protein